VADPNGSVSVVIADDHAVRRRGLRVLLDAEPDQRSPCGARRLTGRGRALRVSHTADAERLRMAPLAIAAMLSGDPG
jgi:DNA-binding NarL/FixJ family response regulator